MQRSLRKRLGLINKTSHRAIAKQCGPCMAGCLYQQIYSKFLKLMLSQGSCEWCRASHQQPGAAPPLLWQVGFQKYDLFFFFLKTWC